jgi:hypothetical protein
MPTVLEHIIAEESCEDEQLTYSFNSSVFYWIKRERLASPGGHPQGPQPLQHRL